MIMHVYDEHVVVSYIIERFFSMILYFPQGAPTKFGEVHYPQLTKNPLINPTLKLDV